VHAGGDIVLLLLGLSSGVTVLRLDEATSIDDFEESVIRLVSAQDPLPDGISYR
jgi:hypothetical protein